MVIAIGLLPERERTRERLLGVFHTPKFTVRGAEVVQRGREQALIYDGCFFEERDGTQIEGLGLRVLPLQLIPEAAIIPAQRLVGVAYRRRTCRLDCLTRLFEAKAPTWDCCFKLQDFACVFKAEGPFGNRSFRF